METEPKKETAIFAAGCFWGVEEAFRKIPGVIDVRVGYTGGHTKSPTYEQVCGGMTGHAEAVKVEFDPEAISYNNLVDKFFAMHDPTTLNRQGPDVGEQYRSAIFYVNDQQKNIAEEKKRELNVESGSPKLIVTEITKATDFFDAEEYHQKYFEKNPDKPHTCLPV